MTNPRDLFRPQREELPQQCASCPFRPGGLFKKIVKKLCDAEGVPFSKAKVGQARAKIMSEVESRGDFVCHGTAYQPDLSMRPQSEWRQCPGATQWFKNYVPPKPANRPTPERLKPTRPVSAQFGKLLSVYGVETRRDPKGPYLVPLVCAEFYANWGAGPLRGLKIETVVKMAVETWKVEGGTTSRAYQIMDADAARAFRAHGILVVNGKHAGEMVFLTPEQAEKYKHLLMPRAY